MSMEWARRERLRLEQEIRLRSLARRERLAAISHQTASMEFHRTAYDQAALHRDHAKIVLSLEDQELVELERKLRECLARIEKHEQEIKHMSDQEAQAGSASVQDNNAGEAAAGTSQGGQSESPKASTAPINITGHTQESSTLVGVNIWMRAIATTTGAQIQGISAMGSFEGKGPRWFIHYTITTFSEEGAKKINSEISAKYSELAIAPSN